MQFDNAHVVRRLGCGFGHIGAQDGCAACHSWHDVSGRCDNDNERHCFAVIPSSGSDGGLVVARTFRRRIDRADTASRVAADGCWGRAFRCS